MQVLVNYTNVAIRLDDPTNAGHIVTGYTTIQPFSGIGNITPKG